MPEAKSSEQELFQEGDWVRCDGQIMYVCGHYADDPKQILLHEKEAVMYYSNGCYSPETVLYPVDAAQKLPDVNVDKDVISRDFTHSLMVQKNLCLQKMI